MNMELSRRQFLKTAGAGVAGTTLGALGFGPIEEALASTIKPFRLVNTTEVRNTCPYCSVACGILIFSKGNLAKGEKADITHIEGDTDHPTNRGTLCPKGAKSRVRYGSSVCHQPSLCHRNFIEQRTVSWFGSRLPDFPQIESCVRLGLHLQHSDDHIQVWIFASDELVH
jgi:hypothetical protein